MTESPKSEPPKFERPKKQIVTGIDISKLSRVRPTRIPSANTVEEVHKQYTNYRKLAVHAGILCLIILIAYGASCIGEFVYNDRYITELLIARSTEESFWSNIVMRAIIQPLSQPWITASFVFDMHNFGYDVVWLHIENIILHALNCFLFYIFVYVLARYFWKDDGREEPVHELALCAAALFACHPLGTESVAHITGRVATLTICNVLLSLNFFLLAFLAKKIKNVFRGYLLTFFFLLQALFCGVQALAIPPCMLMLALLLKPEKILYINWFREKWGEFTVIGSLILLIPLIVLRGFTADYSNGFILPMPLAQVYIASQFQSLISYYLRCFCFPIGLSIIPPFTTAKGCFDPLVIMGFLVLVLGAYLVYRFKNKPMLAIGIGLAILAYLPPMFFVQNEIAADWRFYFSIAGLSLVVASVFKPWLFSWKSGVKVKVFSSLVIALLIALTVLRSLDFHSEIRLMKAALRVDPKNTWAKGMLALALVDRHRTDQGQIIAKEVIALNKTCQTAHLAFGKALIPNKKNVPEAIDQLKVAKAELEEALSLAKSQHLGRVIFHETESALASVLLDLREYKRARDIAEEALAANPNSNKLNIVMGSSLNGLGEYLKALTYLNKAYEHDQTNPDFAEPMTECALGIGTPTFINVAYNISKIGVKVHQYHNTELLLAQSALEVGQLNEALKWGELALKQRPNEARALYLHSFIMKAVGKHKLAQEEKNRALQIDPGMAKKMPITVLKKDRSAVIPFEELYPAARGQ